jgi:hypothetical protein
MYERVARGFRDAGWPDDQVVNGIVALENYILGSALDAVAPANMFDTGDFAHEVPVFDSAVRHRDQSDASSSPADQAFELGLEAIVEGLDAKRKVLLARA